MIEWLQLTNERKRLVLIQASASTGLPAHAIEKDWWVTLTLLALFSSKWKNNLVFKGGTSLSKAWGLIERFSEDVDLAMDREVFGFSEEFVSKSQVAKLRKKAFEFIGNDFRTGLEQTLLEMGVPKDQFTLTVEETEADDKDPVMLILGYHSALESGTYITDKVLIEVGARSKREPSSNRDIQTILRTVFPEEPFSGKPFAVPTVEPRRTFLEKAFLLHEEFINQTERKIRARRLSRHLYDLERLMDTEHAAQALTDYEFYSSIIDHRQKFNAIRDLDYAGHQPSHINFIPPATVIGVWETDYVSIRQNMIYGNVLEFSALIQRLYELQSRFRLILLPKETLDAMEKMNISKEFLAGLIAEAKNSELNSTLKANSLDDGTIMKIPITRNSNIYKPASEENRDRRFMLEFIKQNGAMVFVSISEQ